MVDLEEGLGGSAPHLFWEKKKIRIAKRRKARRASDNKQAPILSSRSGSAIQYTSRLSLTIKTNYKLVPAK